MSQELKMAEARALEAEANMAMAAEYGKDLLIKLNESEKHCSQLEQEKHSLKLELDLKIAAETSMLEELSELTQKVNAMEGQSAQVKELQNALNLAKAEIDHKEEEYKSSLELLQSKLDSAIQSKEPVKMAKPASPELVDDQESAELREELEFVKESLLNHKEELKALKDDHEELQFSNQALQMKVSELKQSLVDKEEELESYRSAQEENMKTVDISLDQSLQSNFDAKGNSLFSEVEDRRHFVEEQLKKCKEKIQGLHVIVEQQKAECSRLRMQNIHLRNVTSSNTGAYGAQEIGRLQEQLQREKNQIKILMSKLEGNEANDVTSDLMRQTLVDGGKIEELSKQVTNQERQIQKLTAENSVLKMRLEEKKHATAKQQPKQATEFIVEDIVFEKSKEPPALPLKEKTNDLPSVALSAQEVKKQPKKSVAFSDDTKEEEREDLQGKKKIPRIQKERTIVDAEQESAKMNEQCKQQ